MPTTADDQYQHLEPRPGSNYRQHAPEEVAIEFKVPLEAVHEALEYVARNRPLIERERDREAGDIRARGLDRPSRPDRGSKPQP